MKQEILVFISDGYADWESAFICAELNEADTGYTIKTVSLDKEAKMSLGGFRTLPDYSVDDYPADFGMLILIGGTAWMQQRNNAVLPLVEYAMNKGIPVGAICAAVNFLAENGCLNQIRHTGNSLAFLQEHCPHYQGHPHFIEQQAVRDGNVVTANGTATLEFAREILLLLKAKPDNMAHEWYQFHKSGLFPL